VPHRCLSHAETTASNSQIFTAVPHRCLSGAETAVRHSHEDPRPAAEQLPGRRTGRR
jgi:hypothetical protein